MKQIDIVDKHPYQKDEIWEMIWIDSNGTHQEVFMSGEAAIEFSYKIKATQLTIKRVQ